MDPKTIEEIGNLIAARDWAKVADLGRTSLNRAITPQARIHALAAICMAARMLGHLDDGKRAYLENIGAIPPTDQLKAFHVVATAAIAAGDTNDLERLFRMQFPNGKQTKVAVSPMRELGVWCGDQGMTTTVLPATGFAVQGTYAWSYGPTLTRSPSFPARSFCVDGITRWRRRAKS